MALAAVQSLSVRRLGLLVALVTGPLAIVEVLRVPAGGGAFPPPPDAVGIALAIGACLPIAVIGSWPRAVMLASAAAQFAAVLLGHGTNLGGLALLITVGLCGFVAGPRAAVLAVLAGAAALIVAPVLTSNPPPLANGLTNGLAMILSALVGAGARVQQRYAAELEARTRELEELRDAETREAVAQERVRIAREVHDVVGHALAAIALHARVASRRLTRDPPAAAGSLAEIADLATSALANTRDAVGQLRTSGSAELRPQPGLDDLDELVAALGASDLTVALRREGEGPTVPAAVQAAAFRIVQEALSNVARHAQPATAAVVVRRKPQALLVEVSDDGDGAQTPLVEGHGLIGMRERAAGLGGTLEAGPASTGGWRVRATLPTGPLVT